MHNKTNQKKLLIIIPAYNEQDNIRSTVKEIEKVGLKGTIIIIDDGSNDDTLRQSLKTGAEVINLPFNLGIGGAVQTGFQYADFHQFDLAVQIDADGQHDPAYVLKLIEPVINDDVDMSIGSRFIPPYLGYQSSLVRRIGIQFFARLISLITAYNVTDPTSGFRAFNKKMIKIFANDYPYDFPEPESIVVAGQFQARIKEVPVQMRKRQSGHSSIRYLKTLYYMAKVTFAILLLKIKNRKGMQTQ